MTCENSDADVCSAPRSVGHTEPSGLKEHRYRESVLGTTIASAVERWWGVSHWNKKVAASAPEICAAMNPATSAARMPANVSLRHRAIVTSSQQQSHHWAEVRT